MKLTTSGIAAGRIHRVMALLSQLDWLVYFPWVAATPALVLLGRLMLDREG